MTAPIRDLDPGIFDAWLRTTDDGALAVDGAGLVVLHNRAASRVTGLAPDAATGRPWREALRLAEPLADALWEARGTGTAHVVAEVLCAQGNLRTVEIAAEGWRDRAGAPGILVVLRDLAVLCRERRAAAGREGYGGLVGAHAAMRALYDLVDAVAGADAPVLVEGETGTGKELVAQALHARSRRAERPLVAVNCAAPAPATLEAELVGQVRGGPGAPGAALGRLELAHTGTLFLDEVDEAPPAVQARLLRFLQSGEFERVGDAATRRADVRVVASASRPLEAAVRAGRFREDLYFRLRVVRVAVPPLRERRSDIPLLAEHFLERHGAAGLGFTPAALAVLQAARWPGNVRELENAVRQAVARVRATPGATQVGPEHLPPEVRAGGASVLLAQPPSREDRKAMLLRALSSHGGNRTAAARALGIGRATFYRWLREAGL